MRVSGALPPGARAVLMVAATSLFMVLVAWATLVGPSQVFTGPGMVEHTLTRPPETCVPLEAVTTRADGTTETVRPDNPRGLPWCGEPTRASQGPTTGRDAEPPAWLKVLVWTFVLAILATIIGLVAFLAALVLGQRGPRRKRERLAQVEFTALGDPARLAEAITADGPEQDALLRSGDPRNAIVAAWQRFEVQGARAGVPRRSWETSSEYAIRILDVVSADSGAVNRLAGLYREARFSEHPVTEEHRARAIEALAVVHRSLGVRA